MLKSNIIEHHRTETNSIMLFSKIILYAVSTLKPILTQLTLYWQAPWLKFKETGKIPVLRKNIKFYTNETKLKVWKF